MLGAFFESPVEWAVANYGKDTNHEHSSRPCDRRRSMLVLGLNGKYVKRRYGRGRYARCQAPKKPRKCSATRSAAKSARKSNNARQTWRREIIAERRYFHKHPELSLKETETANALCWRLASMGIEYTRVPGNGIIATIKGTAPDAYDAEGNPRRRIALRSDIDALPVTELTGAPYASENEGVMHACGHDCHMSMLLGAARILWA